MFQLFHAVREFLESSRGKVSSLWRFVQNIFENETTKILKAEARFTVNLSRKLIDDHRRETSMFPLPKSEQT